jgi:NSS family neurotransmitter:Na+ symporter
MTGTTANREAFGTRTGFLLAAAGSAVGLGNMWRFPYQASEGGGAAFVLVYIVLTLILGIPLMLAEFSIGPAAGWRRLAACASSADGPGGRSGTCSSPLAC